MKDDLRVLAHYLLPNWCELPSIRILARCWRTKVHNPVSYIHWPNPFLLLNSIFSMASSSKPKSWPKSKDLKEQSVYCIAPFFFNVILHAYYSWMVGWHMFRLLSVMYSLLERPPIFFNKMPTRPTISWRAQCLTGLNAVLWSRTIPSNNDSN